MNEFAREGLGGGAKEKEDKDVRMVNELTDELTVCIALREWEEAVNLVEQGTYTVSHSSYHINAQVGHGLL